MKPTIADIEWATNIMNELFARGFYTALRYEERTYSHGETVIINLVLTTGNMQKVITLEVIMDFIFIVAKRRAVLLILIDRNG